MLGCWVGLTGSRKADMLHLTHTRGSPSVAQHLEVLINFNLVRLAWKAPCSGGQGQRWKKHKSEEEGAAQDLSVK